MNHEAHEEHEDSVPPPYAKAMADLGKPLGNPFPLELDIDQRANGWTGTENRILRRNAIRLFRL